MTKTTLNKKMRVFDGEIAIAAAQLYLAHMLQRTLPVGFRIIGRKTGAQVRLYSRPGNDLTHRFPLIVETLARLRSRSCIIDGEAVACDDNGVAS